MANTNDNPQGLADLDNQIIAKEKTIAESESKISTEASDTRTPRQSKAQNITGKQGQGSTTQSATKGVWLPEHSLLVSSGIFVFGILILILIGALIFKNKVKPPENDGQWLIRVIVVPICVLAAILLVVNGFSSEQIAPAIGLLGTILGYLLGAGTRPSAPTAPAPTPTPTPTPVPVPR